MKSLVGKKNLRKRGIFKKQYLVTALVVFLIILLSVSVCFADGEAADEMWNTIADLIKTWVTRLGGVVMFVGGIMFGLGWKNDDADGKTRGINTMIAGGIVIAVAALTSTFFS